MKKAITGKGLLFSESLYGSGREQETDSKLRNSTDLDNLIYPRPSLLPGKVQPQNAREEKIADNAYQQGYEACERANSYDRMQQVLSEQVEIIRKKLIKKGRIQPANKKERKWKLGIE